MLFLRMHWSTTSTYTVPESQTGWYWMNRARDLFLSSWLCFSLFGEHALLKLAKALAILLGSVKPSTDTDSLHLL